MADTLPTFLQQLDIDRIRRGDAYATADAITALQFALNNEILTRSQVITPWKDVPYDAANFLGSFGTWTVTPEQVADLKYLKFGTMIVLEFQFNRTGPGLPATIVSAPMTTVAVRIPELRAKVSRRGLQDDAAGYNGCWFSDDVGEDAGLCFVTRRWNSIDEPAAVLNIEAANGRDIIGAGLGLSTGGFCVFEIEG